jgi:branched-chain amino acid transport system permease protein
MLTLLFDGLAYGMVLFILAVGLSITLGLMNFVNLAHGVFAAMGGYAAALAFNKLNIPFLACLPLAFLVAAFAGLVLERTLYVRLYARTHLDQVLFTIGLSFMAIAGLDYLFGSSQQFIKLPSFLTGRFDFYGIQIGKYRGFIILLCGLITLSLQYLLTRTRFGAQLRASVDDARVARGLGLPVNRLFMITFALGSGLAGLGGALSIEILGLDPSFPLKFMIFMLVVVTVGGTKDILAPFLAAILVGLADVFGKYYLPSLGSFIIYFVMVAALTFRPQGLFTRAV